MNKKDITVITPPNIGWLEYKLNSKEMDYVWRCIENKKEKTNKTLAGNISASYSLMDRGDWFWMNVILPLVMHYADDFRNMGKQVPIKVKHPYCLDRWWVNYQKQNEFNPIHNHTGVYSFVIWMKIPYFFEKQNLKDIARGSNNPQIGNFQFSYQSLIGELMVYDYKMNPNLEGTMLFFPAQLDHQVYPFYDCDEERISVSGNISVDSSKRV
tara:strand:+ start:120 stop:755 length:636 start_codon:yes stop_codon:yes gene_type:complete